MPSGFAHSVSVLAAAVVLVHTSRYLTIESASLPFFALFLSAYVQRCHKLEVKHWYRALLWLVIGLSINYKFVLVLPVLVLLELLNPKPFLKGKPLLFGLGILLLPVLVWSFAGHVGFAEGAARPGVYLRTHVFAWVFGVAPFSWPEKMAAEKYAVCGCIVQCFSVPKTHLPIFRKRLRANGA